MPTVPPDLPFIRLADGMATLACDGPGSSSAAQPGRHPVVAQSSQRQPSPMQLAADWLPTRNRNALLRRLRLDDLHAFQAYRHDPALARYQGWCPVSDPEALAFLEEMASAPLLQPGQWIQLAIADPHTDQLLGDIGLYVAPDSSSAELGFTLARAAQGRGVATAAAQAAVRLLFACTAVARVVGITDARNEPSVRLLSRIGMRMVESRQSVFKGEACTEQVFSMARGRPLSSNSRHRHE